MVFQQKNGHTILRPLGRFYANETPLTADFYPHNSLVYALN